MSVTYVIVVVLPNTFVWSQYRSSHSSNRMSALYTTLTSLIVSPVGDLVIYSE